MKLIVGLGNPGKRYAKTRHNAGFMAVDALHTLLLPHGIGPWELSKKFNAAIAGCSVGGEKILLAKPMTFMNDSGVAVQLIAHFYQIPTRDIILVHDDKDIALGTVKIHTDRGHAGHNGVRSVMERVGSDDLTRVRIGIKSENEKKMADVSRFVLEHFGIFEKRAAARAVAEAAAMTRARIEQPRGV